MDGFVFSGPKSFLNLPMVSLAWEGKVCAVPLQYLFNIKENEPLNFNLHVKNFTFPIS